MTNDDPFFSGDDPFFSGHDGGPTVIRPVPGGRRPSPAEALPSSRLPAEASAVWAGELTIAAAENPLIACAASLLTLAAQLRGTASHPDPAGLLDGLTARVREFETCARARGLTDPVVLPARYVLCALLDESVLDTPWGSESTWGERGLLVTFHNETWGGEKFFHALDRLLAYPSGNLQLLELMYLGLALGFEGRYRVRDRGRAELEQVRENLYLTIRHQRGEAEPELSPRWQGVRERRDPLLHALPLWVLAAIAGVLLLGLFSSFTFALHRSSDDVFTDLAEVGRDIPIVVERPDVPPPVVDDEPPSGDQIRPTLRMLLADDIAAGRVEVIDRPLGQTVMLRGDGLFPSARTEIRRPLVPLLDRIGKALAQLPGRVLITGHTDSVPIRTLRFPSNQVLSQARAESVRNLLAKQMGGSERLTAEGRGATESLPSLKPTDPRNRRVEITLMPGPANRVDTD